MANDRVTDVGDSFRLASGPVKVPPEIPPSTPRSRRTLRDSLVLFAMAVTLPILALAIATAVIQHRALRDSAEQALVAQARGAALLIDREFASAERVLQALASQESLAGGDRATFWSRMQAAAAITGADVVNLIDATGTVRLSTRWQPDEGREMQSTGPAMEVLRTGRTVYSNLFGAPTTGALSVAVSMPVRGWGGSPGSVAPMALGLIVPRHRLLGAVTEQQLPAGAIGLVLDRNLTIVARTQRDAETVGTQMPPNLVAAMPQGAGMSPFAYASLDGTRVVAAYAQAPRSGFWAKIVVPAELFEQPLRRSMWTLIAAGLTLLLVSLALGAALAGRIAMQLHRLGGLDGATPPSPSGLQEVDDLAATLSRQAAAREAAVAEMRALFDASPVGVLRCDAGGRVQHANEAFLRMVGLTEADLRRGGLRWDDLTPAEWLDRDEAAIAEAVRLGACTPYQKEFIRPDGTRVPVLILFALHDRSAGAGAAFVVDISAWRGTDGELARAQEKMRLAIGAADIYFWDWNVVAGTVEWSEGLERACGLPKGGFDNRIASFRALVHPEDLPRVDAEIATALAGEANYETEFRVCRPDGEVRWLIARATVLRDGAGRAIRMIGIDFDITDRKRAEAALREEKLRLRRVQQIGGIGGFEFDLRSGAGRRSSEYMAVNGLPPFACTEAYADWVARLHPADRAQAEQHYRDCVADGAPCRDYAQEYRIVTPEGETRWIAARAEIERDAEGRALRMVGAHLDITTLRATECKLRRSETRLRLAQEAGRIGVWDWNLITGGAVCSPVYYELNGLPADAPSPTYENWLSRVHPDDRDRAAAAVAAAMETGRYDDEFRIMLPDGSLRWIASHGLLHRNKEGQAARFIGVNLDISARKQAEAALAESEGQLRAFFASIDEGWCLCEMICDETGRPTDYRILDVNPLFEKMSGLAGAVGRTARELVPGLEGDWIDLYARAALGGERLRFEHGSIAMGRWFDVFAAPVAPAGRFSVVFRDITGKRMIEAALRDSEARLRLAMEAGGLGAWSIDMLSGALAADAPTRSMFGATSEEPVDLEWVISRLADREDRARLRAAAASATDPAGTGTCVAEIRLRQPDGSLRWLSLRGLTSWDEGKSVALRITGTALDITAQKEAEALLVQDRETLEARVAERTEALTLAAAELTAEMRRREEAQAALIHAQKLEALGQLTSGVAHDFNNVLAATIGSLHLIARRVPPDDPVSALARNGRQAAERGAALVRQLLAFARRDEAALEAVPTAALMQEAVTLVRHAVGAGVTVTLRVANDVWPMVSDPRRLEAALLNLAVNARDAMEGSGTLIIDARNALAPGHEDGLPHPLQGTGDFVVITVEDDGPGMTEEVLARATEPFFTTKPRGHGTGLGLAMAKSYVESLGGALRIVSAGRTGTAVRIWLPRAAEVPDQHSAPPQEEDDASLHGGATVLVVDDDEHVRVVTATHLRDMGYAVLEADGVAMAQVQALAAERLDLLVTDVAMPAGGGLALAERLRAARPQLPVVFVTGYAEHLGVAAEVLRKPFSPRELGSRVLGALGRLPSRPGPRAPAG